jgi:hypothetical protein
VEIHDGRVVADPPTNMNSRDPRKQLTGELSIDRVCRNVTGLEEAPE